MVVLAKKRKKQSESEAKSSGDSDESSSETEKAKKKKKKHKKESYRSMYLILAIPFCQTFLVCIKCLDWRGFPQKLF